MDRSFVAISLVVGASLFAGCAGGSLPTGSALPYAGQSAVLAPANVNRSVSPAVGLVQHNDDSVGGLPAVQGLHHDDSVGGLPAARVLHHDDSVGGLPAVRLQHHHDSLGGLPGVRRLHHDDSVGGLPAKKH